MSSGDGDGGSGETAALVNVAVLHGALLNSANFSSIATDANGLVQIFNVGAAHTLGYGPAEVINKLTLAKSPTRASCRHGRARSVSSSAPT